MSREIKFRAWHKKFKKMLWVTDISWQVEDYKDDQGNVVGGMWDIDGVEKLKTKDGKDHQEYGSLEDFEIMQFTGLKDKNGTDVYEGDILDLENGRWEVKFDAWNTGKMTGIGFYLERMGLVYNRVIEPDLWNVQLESVVVGNIYET